MFLTLAVLIRLGKLTVNYKVEAPTLVIPEKQVVLKCNGTTPENGITFDLFPLENYADTALGALAAANEISLGGYLNKHLIIFF